MTLVTLQVNEPDVLPAIVEVVDHASTKPGGTPAWVTPAWALGSELLRTSTTKL